MEIYTKSCPPPGFDLRTVQPVASRYTDWAIPAHGYHISIIVFCMIDISYFVINVGFFGYLVTVWLRWGVIVTVVTVIAVSADNYCSYY